MLKDQIHHTESITYGQKGFSPQIPKDENELGERSSVFTNKFTNDDFTLIVRLYRIDQNDDTIIILCLTFI